MAFQRIRKIIVTALCAAVLLTLLSGCSLLGDGPDTADYSKRLGIDLSAAEVKQYSDTHGGFTGDGKIFVQYTFADGAPDFPTNEYWHALPLSASAERIVDSLILDENYKPLIPQVQNGMWFFCDRHSESTDPADGTGIFDRYSFNFDFAVFDADTNTLYFTIFDT